MANKIIYGVDIANSNDASVTNGRTTGVTEMATPGSAGKKKKKTKRKKCN
jgi:hypothetical protein